MLWNSIWRQSTQQQEPVSQVCFFFYVYHYDVKLACACPNMKSMLSYRRYTPLNVKKLCAKRSYHAHILPHHKGQLLRRWKWRDQQWNELELQQFEKKWAHHYVKTNGTDKDYYELSHSGYTLPVNSRQPEYSFYFCFVFLQVYIFPLKSCSTEKELAW